MSYGITRKDRMAAVWIGNDRFRIGWWYRVSSSWSLLPWYFCGIEMLVSNVDDSEWLVWRGRLGRFAISRKLGRLDA
jgi:hypothetical protein